MILRNTKIQNKSFYQGFKMQSKEWPLSFKDLVKIGDTDSNLAIITLWTPIEAIQKYLNKEDYAILSNLYSKDAGLNTLIRGCLTNKKIRYILITGQDLSKSGQALINLKQNGIDENNKVIGIENSFIDKEIPKKTINNFRNNVEIIDLRNLKDFPQLKNEIKKLEKKQSYGEPETFPETKIELPQRFPAEHSGFKITAKTVGEAWLQILQTVMKFGFTKDSEKGEQQKEIVDLIVSITEEDPENISWKKYFNFTKEELENYYPQVLNSISPETVTYTYGKRLMNFKGKDQIKSIINKLKKHHYSRRAIAVLWDVETDIESEEPPCFNTFQAIIQENKLYLTVYIRSNDTYDAWPRNAFAIRKLQKRIADEINCKLGDLITIISSAHIYSRSFKAVTTLLKEYPIIDNVTFDLTSNVMQDPRGNINIEVIDKKIKITHLTQDGKRIDEHYVKNAKEGILWIRWQQKISDVHHAMFIGQELEKAEIALKNNLKYTLDKQLDLKN